MNKLFTLSLIATLFIFSGCSEEKEDTKPDTQNASLECAQEYFDTTISTVLTSCVSCHSDGGQAQASKLVLISPLEENKDTNFDILKTYIDLDGSVLVEKGSNEITHAGGVQLSGTSKENMQTFVDYIQGTTTCVVEDVNTSSTITNASISLLSPTKTLRSASFKIQGKAPSQEDLNASVGIENIDTILDTYMQSDEFYDWLRQNFNDFLLTDFYTPGRRGEDLLNSDDFPEKRWWVDLNDGEYSQLDEYTNYAISREPIELMIHVIKEGRPFSEILTADYVMVNPFSAKTYDINIDNFTYIYEANKTREYIEEKYPQDLMREGKITGIPHAGLLTTITFLNRFPSTDTNLDRHRSAKTQLFFLDTDILGLANRPINSTEVISDTATWTNPNCTVCHNVMEPISSSFKNWDNRGRYMPGFRGDAVQPAGLSMENKTPQSESNNLLQWLAKEMVKDDRFAKASVKIFFKALLGRDAMKMPESDDVEYAEKLEAYNYENNILEDIKEKFIANNMDAKVIIKELIKSPLFRATAISSTNTILSENIGQAKLISPEELNRKIYDVMGYYWSSYWRQTDVDNNRSYYHRLLSENQYKILYGGMNSGSVATRVDELNGIMANVQMRMALQMSCYPVTRDFFFEPSKRKLFPYVTTTLEPENEFFIAAIKKNIQYLHKHILGEELADGDLELEKTYQLFLDTYNEGNTRILNGNESQELMDECDLHYDPVTGEYLYSSDPTIDRRYERIDSDEHYVIRSWQVVIAYLLSDFKFVYENSAE